ncbi:hypothetical protein CO046_00115 [Candidatus Peregrinibacteria bacterium CG_4_9_14_0_2_um_filter_53_11]|nr:MAG: hypothetical protein CO046_00115 [Candidatus Peregrinibacteria bacterium CG_4_9_14_0_2_um_filter_53_11]
MITLPYTSNLSSNFLSVVKEENEPLWKIYIGSWYQTGIEDVYHSTRLKTTEPIVLGASDLIQMASEIRRCLELKNIRQERLQLTFKQNKPDMRMIMYYMDEGADLYSPKEKGLFAFAATISLFYSAQKFREEYYQEEEPQTGLMMNYPPELLAKFADDLEAEALPYLPEEKVLKVKEKKNENEATGFSKFLRFFKKK